MRFRCLWAVLVVGLTFTGPAAVSAAPAARPDGSIRQLDEVASVGKGVYNTTGVGQTSERRIGERGRGTFLVAVENDGTGIDDVRVRGTSHSLNYSVQYRLAGVDVSDDVKTGNLVLHDLGPGETRTITILVATRRSVPRGTTQVVHLRSRSVAVGTVDTVRAVVVRPLYSEDQLTVIGQINASRGHAGRARVRMDPVLAAKAQVWSQHLARVGRLQHSDLTSGVPAGWRALAENVGYHQDLIRMHAAFLASPGHRDNLLGPYNRVGTGVTRSGGRVYVVHVFMRT